MAYDEYIVDRIARVLNKSGKPYISKKMMGGMVFMVNDKMACGTHYDNKKKTDLIMARIGKDAAESYKEKNGCQPMDFTGRPMKDYVFITPEGFDSDDDLEFWIELCLAYNPLAKASKKKKK